MILVVIAAILEAIEVIEMVAMIKGVGKRARARNRLVSVTAMVHGVVGLVPPPPITFSGARQLLLGLLLPCCAHAYQVEDTNWARSERDTVTEICGLQRSSFFHAGSWGGGGCRVAFQVGGRDVGGLSTLMRWQARGLAGLGSIGRLQEATGAAPGKETAPFFPVTTLPSPLLQPVDQAGPPSQ